MRLKVLSDQGNTRDSPPSHAPFALHLSSRICFSSEELASSFSLIDGSTLLLNCFLPVFTKQNED